MARDLEIDCCGGSHFSFLASQVIPLTSNSQFARYRACGECLLRRTHCSDEVLRSMSGMGRPRESDPIGLDFNGFCDGQRILKLNAQVSNGAVHLRVAQKELYCSQIAGLLIDLGDLGSTHRMRAVGARL